MLFYNPRLRTHARSLRRNMTVHERRLWAKIRNRQLKGYRFYRQRTIGNYIVDFYSPSARLIVEVDGGQHFTETGEMRDKGRDEYLTNQRIRILRLSNREIMENMDGVVEAIIINLP